MDQSIIEFIGSNRVAGVCFVKPDGAPHCISCFYVFDTEKKQLIFKSTTGTGHDKFTLTRNKVAGTINPEQFDSLKIQGIQFTGEVIEGGELNTFDLSKQYYLKYPFAMVMPGYLWAVKLTSVKFTDNTQGFGTKISWEIHQK